MSSHASPRRSKYAPGLLVLLALAMTALLYGFVAPRADAKVGASDAEIRAGEQLYSANCAYCHGSSAQGTDVGPSLIGVGAASVDFQVATGRMPMVSQQAQAPAKKPVFNQTQINQLAAYVASLSPGPLIPTDKMVDPKLGNSMNGMLLYRNNCAMCHNVAGAGGALSEGKYAPPIGQTSYRHIYEAMLTGPQAMPVFNDTSITPEGKRDIIAYLAEQRDVATGGLTLGSLGPVAEGFWVWAVGLGSLILIAVWVGARAR